MTNMKNKSIILLLTLGLAFSACSRDEGNLFDKSAAERTVEALENAQKCLVEAPNGWEFLYFCNPITRGYNILVKFDEHGQVTASAKAYIQKGSIKTDSIVVDANSTWEVVSDYGPILTFNTYNDVLHLWADPQADGDGFLGDYEFLILEATPERIVLKGKKHSGYSVLRRLPKDQDWTEYFTDIENMQKKLFSNSNLLLAEIGGEKYTLTDGASGIFTFANKGEAPNEDDPILLPFATTQKGIYCTTFLTEERYIDIPLENGVLKSSAATISTGNLNEYFEYYMRLLGGKWKYNMKDQVVKDVFAPFDAVLQEKYGNKKAKTTDLFWQDGNSSKTTKQLAYSYTSTGKNADVQTMFYNFNAEQSGSQLKLTYIGPADDNTKNFTEAFATIVETLKNLGGDCSLSTTEEAINPTLGLQINNASKVFTLTGTIK